MLLSVVVTIVEGGAALSRCLTALTEQDDPPPLEILLPYDESVAEAGALARRFTGVVALPLGRVATQADPASARGEHELFDRRRAHALAAATGDVVAMLEDRGVPARDWARTVARLHRDLPHAVIGGAVENGIDRPANWAVYFCDFSRYQRPFAAGPAPWITDVNISYKRRALEATRSLWRERYHEPVVHAALRRHGETLYLTPELVVEQMRTRTSLHDLLRERLHWGRLFAYTRIKSRHPAARLAYLAASPLIPFVMFTRQARLQWTKGNLRRFLAVAPAVAGLHAVWGVGEAIGYFTGKP
jgi:hypothetical protein